MIIHSTGAKGFYVKERAPYGDICSNYSPKYELNMYHFNNLCNELSDRKRSGERVSFKPGQYDDEHEFSVALIMALVSALKETTKVSTVSFDREAIKKVHVNIMRAIIEGGDGRINMADWAGHKKCLDEVLARGGDVRCKISSHLNKCFYIAEAVWSVKYHERDTD
jgi:hypothetical protein